jgi:threonine/homoserine/homoserine lactone efflux protein
VEIINFVLTIILVTASGALAPGPLFFETISKGSKIGAKSGIIFSVAHTVVEFSLIMLFALGLIKIANEPIVKFVIGLLGGITLIIFGLLQVYRTTVYNSREPGYSKSSFRHLFLIGLAFTGLNPYFLIWWLTVGANLIIISLEFAAFAGVIFMYICHVWIDYVWLTSIAHLAKKGSDIIGNKWYKTMMILFGFILVYFGLTFIYGAFLI